jgi:hypothetical protein
LRSDRDRAVYHLVRGSIDRFAIAQASMVATGPLSDELAETLVDMPAIVALFHNIPAGHRRGTFEQVEGLVAFLRGEPHSAIPKPPMNEAKHPLFPQLHRHAAFGKLGIARTICRVLDPINVRAGRLLGDQVSHDDIKAVTDALGEQATLSPLREIVERAGINGSKWLNGNC